MKKLLFFIVLLLPCLSYALSLTPAIVGNGSTDSVTVFVPINDIDTVQVYTSMNLAGSDKISYWYYGPDGVLVDSDTNSSNITKILDGVYKIRLKSSNATATVGDYTVVVQVYFKGKWRAAGTISYQVTDEQLNTYLETITSHVYYDGGCDDCTQTWYSRSVGGKVVTDSIIIKNASAVRVGKIRYSRTPGSTVITGVTYERF